MYHLSFISMDWEYKIPTSEICYADLVKSWSDQHFVFNLEKEKYTLPPTLCPTHAPIVTDKWGLLKIISVWAPCTVTVGEVEGPSRGHCIKKEKYDWHPKLIEPPSPKRFSIWICHRFYVNSFYFFFSFFLFWMLVVTKFTRKTYFLQLTKQNVESACVFWETWSP